MIIISILFWKIKYTWAKFLRAVLFGDVSFFFKKRKKEIRNGSRIWTSLLIVIFLGFFPFSFIICFGFSPNFSLLLSSLKYKKVCSCSVVLNIKYLNHPVTKGTTHSRSSDHIILQFKKKKSICPDLQLANSLGIPSFRKLLFPASLFQTLCLHPSSNDQLGLWFLRKSLLFEMTVYMRSKQRWS